jgi:hypothetical protein
MRKIRHIKQQLMYAIILNSPNKTNNYTTTSTCNGIRTIQHLSTTQKAGEWGPMRTPKTDRKVADLLNLKTITIPSSWQHIPTLELY